MWYHRSIPCFFLLFVHMIALWGQGNLIPNPSFEKDPLHYGVKLYEDPMYIKSKKERPHGKVVINNTFAISCSDCYAIKKCHSGNNCTVLYNSGSMGEGSSYRSLIQGKLIEALQKDSLYYYSTYLCNSYSNPYNTEIPLILLMDSVYSEKLPIQLHNFQKLRVPVTRDSNWQKVSISFKADDNYKYFILGEADEKSPVIKIPKEKHKTIQTVIDDLWLSQDSIQIIEEFEEVVSKIFEQKFFFDTGESEIINRDGIFSDIESKDITLDSITIHSYTDGQGSVEANLELSGLRSQAARDLLLDQFKEVPAHMIRMYNFGELACGEIENQECRYSLLKIYYHTDKSVLGSVAESSTKPFLSPIVLSKGDTVYVINQELDFKMARNKRQYQKAIHLIRQDKYNGEWNILQEEAELWSMSGECDSAMVILAQFLDDDSNSNEDWVFSNPYLINCRDHPLFLALNNNYINSHLTDSVHYPGDAGRLWEASMKDQSPYGLIQSHEISPQEDSKKIIDSLWLVRRDYQQENEDLPVTN